MLMNEYVKLADVLEIVERYVAPRGRKGSVNLMREIESLPRREKMTKLNEKMTGLKPCPFCGGEVKLMNYGPEEWGYCENCGASTDRDGAWYQRQPIIIDYKEASQKKPRTSIEIGCKVDTKEIDAAVEKVRELRAEIDLANEKIQTLGKAMRKLSEAKSR